MINTVIFDVGNVLTEFGWQQFILDKGYSSKIAERVGKATIMDPDWSEYDRGILTDEEIVARFIDNDPDVEKEIREVNASLTGILKKCDYAIPWIKELKGRGLKVLFLSNFSRKAYAECHDVLDFEPLTDGGIWSYRVGMIKPGRGIYHELLDTYDLVPEECVFIDDTAENLATAKDMGINVILFKDYVQAYAELNSLIGVQVS
ncbi:MAG: HAD family phosphatase [Lachnospiraceae bacterium]|nr:HAD family phosphatase [Lachnospiraceae bacterium]